MSKHYYKGRSVHRKKILKIVSMAVLLCGISVLFYIFFPLILWQVYVSRALAYDNVKAPIPTNAVISSDSIKNLLSSAANVISGVDYTNAQNWFPNLSYGPSKTKVPSYTISIPRIGIEDAEVTTIDNNLTRHLVNYPGTAIPGEMGNAVIFGHSTLPTLFNKRDYKTIFANIHTLEENDRIVAKINNATYSYKVVSISVVDPDDTSSLAQTYDDSYLTLVTCTPPGTIWKRLVIKARVEKI